MTKEELRKEATETIEWKCTPMIDRPLFVHAYITGAEPREKRIAELEKENAELRNIAEFQQSSNMSRYFENKKLKDENVELKGEADSVLDNWCKGGNPYPHLKKRDEQFTKAKELIEELSSSLSVGGECGEEECELLNRA